MSKNISLVLLLLTLNHVSHAQNTGSENWVSIKCHSASRPVSEPCRNTSTSIKCGTEANSLPRLTCDYSNNTNKPLRLVLYEVKGISTDILPRSEFLPAQGSLEIEFRVYGISDEEHGQVKTVVVKHDTNEVDNGQVPNSVQMYSTEFTVQR
jgi:hypothetical protein